MRSVIMMAALLCAALPARAADYVFTYNGGYLAVGNNGAVIFTTTLSPQCVWTCVSSTTNLTAATLGTTSYYLYTTDVNGTRRWLIGSTTNGAAITTSTNAGTARWRADGNRLFWRNGGNYYAYYRDNTWRTSNSSNGNSNGVNAYRSGNNSGTDYRSTTYQVTVSTETSTSSGPTINGADVLTATGNSTYTATGATYRIGYTNYRFNNADHYVDADGNSFTGTPANATITNTWSLTDNAYATVNSTSGVVTVTSLPEYDITLTLTVTATATGGNPAAPAGTTFTDTKEITIQGTKPSAPTITVNGTSVTLATDAAGSTTIRYTLDGTDPTASTGTVYSGAIDLSGSTTSPVTIKAITVRSGNTSDVTEQSVTLTLPEPTITINGEAKTATIASSIAGATIYYTTDGTTPTTSSSQYSTTLTGLDYMTTIKAIAVKDGWNNSPVASGIVTIPSGVGGGVVTLFDYEPHSWSYYSDPNCPIRSLSPADVKITYYGDGIVMTGNADYTSSSTDFIQPGNANYVGGAKVNVTTGEDQNTFIYYKTLERDDATQTAWTFSSGSQSSAASRCPYTTIPNPFQVRPTYGTPPTSNRAAWTGWRGFQCWRLKSVTGGAVYSAANGVTALSVGAVVNAETEIYFAPNSEYGMDVELEAVWAIAYIVYANNNGNWAVPDHADKGYERNFVVLSSNKDFYFGGGGGNNTANITNINRPSTITPYLPNGTSGNGEQGRVQGVYANNAADRNITLQAETKFENVQFSYMGERTLTAANHDVIIGRGCSGTINYVRGVNANVTSPNYTIRLESGTFNYVSFIRGYWTGSNNYTDNGSTVSGSLDIKVTLGCDYDRASNTDGITDNLKITKNAIMGAQNTISDNTNKQKENVNVTVKSGKIGSDVTINSNDGYMADAYQTLYMSVSNAQTYVGRRNLVIEGGELSGVAGGIDAHFLGTGVSNNNVTGITATGITSFYVRMSGGKVRGAIYGGAAKSPGSGDRRMTFTGGTINGWVGCGCNGTEDDGGKTYGASYLYFGGNAECSADPSHDYTMNGTKGGYVFGAGKGYAGGSGTSGEMTYGTTLVVSDNAVIQRDIFGGGNYGYALVSTNVFIGGNCSIGGNAFGGSNLKDGPTITINKTGGTITGGLYGGSNENGTVTSVDMSLSGGTTEGGVYGGGLGTNSVSCNVTGAVGITMTGGTVLSGLYGGGNVNSTIGSSVTMQINGGQVGTPESNANIHGGGFGSLTAVTGNVSVTLGASTSAADSATVNGNVFGGSALGRTNTGNATNTTTVTMNKALVNGNLFGGALGNGAVVNGKITVNVNGGRVNGNIFGGGDAAAYSPSSNHPVVNMTGGQAINVFGGGRGNTATVTGNPQVTLSGNAHVTGNVYGGGDAAQVTGHTNVQLHD